MTLMRLRWHNPERKMTVAQRGRRRHTEAVATKAATPGGDDSGAARRWRRDLKLRNQCRHQKRKKTTTTTIPITTKIDGIEKKEMKGCKCYV
jgi:hypothetical protein